MITDMEDTDTLSNEDIGHLLEAKAEKLIDGEQDADTVLREVLETLAKSKGIRTREKTVDTTGRVSLGRDLTGVHGVALFQPDPAEREDGD